MRAARCLLLWAAVSVTGWSTASRQWRERGGGIGIGNGDGDGRAHREEEITRPQRLQQRADGEGGELAHGRLDTRVKSEDADALHPIHLAQLSFLVKAFGTSFILDLELNQQWRSLTLGPTVSERAALCFRLRLLVRLDSLQEVT
ncbi:hypothetical protein PDJAM_G00031670 [Pangasius djambal]|uniref:Uncharacterized protein n=1 Tax=Pangasius djambal TaxID=1691987 RepID=A0ACC5YR57_9TELE|nr:hypothetical protein [Pangasius djambal]